MEARIAKASGIPVHAEEDMMTFARIRDRATSGARGRHFPPFGLHHETDMRCVAVLRTLLWSLLIPWLFANLALFEQAAPGEDRADVPEGADGRREDNIPAAGGADRVPNAVHPALTLHPYRPLTPHSS